MTGSGAPTKAIPREFGLTIFTLPLD